MSESFTKSPSGMLRANGNKPKLSWIPYPVLAAICTVFQRSSEIFGGKYPSFNWTKTKENREEATECLLRHGHKYADGQDIDPDTGLPEPFLIGANAVIMIWDWLQTETHGDYRDFSEQIKKMETYLKTYWEEYEANNRRDRS